VRDQEWHLGSGRPRLLAAGIGVVVLACVLGALLWPGHQPSSVALTHGTSARPATAPAAASPPSPPAAPPPLASVGLLDPVLAAGTLTAARIPVPGTVQQALQWQDANGRNLLLAGKRPIRDRDGRESAGAIVVMLVTHLDTRATRCFPAR
jgi:hypothetical protein